jgi:hypothetical protein
MIWLDLSRSRPEIESFRVGICTPNEEADCKLEEWKDFLKPYSPLDPEPGLGGILSLGSFPANATSFLNKIRYS